MKKILLTCFLVLCLSICFTLQTDAQPLSSLKGKNLLNLSNIRGYDDGLSLGYTYMPIQIKKTVIYTLVFDAEYLSGQVFDEITDHSLFIKGHGTAEAKYVDYESDENRLLAYLEFSMTVSEWIHFEDFPLPWESHNVMLYEGRFVHFSGFEPFIHPDETMSYHGYLPIDYDHMMSLEQIKQLIIAKSPNGQVIPYDTVIDEFSSSDKLPGTYHMEFKTSMHNITKRLYLEVRIFDLADPIITLLEPIEIPLASKWTLDQIKTKIQVSDNVDDLTVDDLAIIIDTYSDATTVGTYTIKVQATDSSGNQSTLNIPISLVDKTRPVIHGPQAIYLYTTDAPLSNAQILSRFHATDDVDGAVTTYIMTNTYHQTTQSGKYEIHLGAHDKQGNTANKIVYIHVIENRGPEFEMDESILEASIKDQMSEEDIIDWFKARLLSFGHQASHVRVIFNEYQNHKTESGSYYVYLSYQLGEEEYTSRIRIDVEAEEKQSLILPISLGIGTITLGFIAFYLTKRKKI
jgi:hypothetical protein